MSGRSRAGETVARATFYRKTQWFLQLFLQIHPWWPMPPRCSQMAPRWLPDGFQMPPRCLPLAPLAPKCHRNVRQYSTTGSTLSGSSFQGPILAPIGTPLGILLGPFGLLMGPSKNILFGFLRQGHSLETMAAWFRNHRA